MLIENMFGIFDLMCALLGIGFGLIVIYMLVSVVRKQIVDKGFKVLLFVFGFLFCASLFTPTYDVYSCITGTVYDVQDGVVSLYTHDEYGNCVVYHNSGDMYDNVTYRSVDSIDLKLKHEYEIGDKCIILGAYGPKSRVIDRFFDNSSGGQVLGKIVDGELVEYDRFDSFHILFDGDWW